MSIYRETNDHRKMMLIMNKLHTVIEQW